MINYSYPNCCITWNRIVILWVLAFNLLGFQILAQDTSPDADTLESYVVTEKEHSPHLATIYSMVLPGLGQAYNKKYWKIPIVYAGLGTSLYFLQRNNARYEVIRKGYKDFIDADPSTNSYMDIEEIITRNVEDEQIKAQLDYYKYEYRRNRDLSVILTGVIYFLNIVDAAVDAHFYDFDVSDDFSLRLEPIIHFPGMAYQGYGIKVRLEF